MKARIFILSILLISFVSAQNIDVNYPEEVYVDKEFSFKISLLDFESGTYDVKIDIFGEGNRISRVLDGEKWKSTYYYVTNAISENEEKEFTLKIENYVGIADVEIKIRKSGTTIVKTFSDYTIKSIQEGDSSQENNEEEEDIEEQESKIENKKETSSGNLGEITSATGKTVEKETTKEVQTIVLNPKDIKSGENSEKIKRNYPLYGLILFSLLLAILFWVRKKGNKNEF